MAEEKSIDDRKMDDILAKMPSELGILPISDVTYPHQFSSLQVRRPGSTQLIDDAMKNKRLLGLVALKNTEVENPTPEDLYSTGVVGTILQMRKVSEDNIHLIVHGRARIKIGDYVQTEPYLKATAAVLPDEYTLDLELEALARSVREMFERAIHLAGQLPDGLKIMLQEIDEPSKLTDLVAQHLDDSIEEKQAILEAPDLRTRLELVSRSLAQQLERLELTHKIRAEAKDEMDKAQQEFYLRKQLDAIYKELDESDGEYTEIEELEEKIEEVGLPPEAKKEAERELKRLKRMPTAAAEYTVSRTYLDWLLELPWNTSTEDNLDIKRAKEILDADHYGLTKVKDRILEYLSVRKLRAEIKGPILCFVGPPGVGKTSLGQSIARAMERKFVRLSLGGVRDEAEIRGHRRTYIGALPGRIIQSLRKVSVNNPLFMLDEVDKLGTDFRGDPASALLEVLDPEQNYAFSDHFLDVPFDLSKIFFITTANILDTIPPALQDRMEVIRLPGYTEFEKINIAKGYLIKKQLDAHGLTDEALKIADEALGVIIRDYTREAGVRNLERELATVCRKVATVVAEGNTEKTTITADNISEYLGVTKFFSEETDKSEEPGIAVGLAWTQAGGDILSIEATKMQKRRKDTSFTLTGQLGDVMQESAQAALSYVKTHYEDLKIDENFFKENEIHIHIPAGDVPKDGPSAGVTIVTTLASLATGRSVKSKLAMTGEISLRGKVLPVGGIKEKVLAASRAGIDTIILPLRNKKDLDEVPAEIKEKLTFHFVDGIDKVLELALLPSKTLALVA